MPDPKKEATSTPDREADANGADLAKLFREIEGEPGQEPKQAGRQSAGWLRNEAKECRMKAGAYLGRPEAELLHRMARAFDELAKRPIQAGK